MFTTLNYPGAGGTFAYAINDRGQITGQFDTQSFLAVDPPNPVSELSVLVLLLTGLIAIALFLRR